MKNILQMFKPRGKALGLLIVFFALLSYSSHLSAQSTMITGTIVSDDGETLPGVTVRVKDSNKGTITNAEGYFSLEVDPDDVLIMSFVGFKTQVIPVNGRTQFNVTMEIDITELSEVVVIGYGTQKKSHLTGAISKVTNENLEQLPFARVDDALVGQIAGVQIGATSEQGIGGDPTILVRGVGSISAGSGPLLVVDGAPVGSEFLGNLDMNDIESFEILKDAASASIYGSRGANGVIMITTKGGQEGPVKFNYNGFFGYQDAIRSDDYNTSIDDHIAFELANNERLSPATQYKQLIGFTDWQDIYFDGGFVNSHSLSARGGNKKTKFSTSLSYLHDEGVLLTDDFKKVNFKTRVDTKVSDKFSFGININPSYTRRRRFPDAIRQVLRADAPWLPERHTEHTLQFVNDPTLEVGDFAKQEDFDGFVFQDILPDGSTEDVTLNISNTGNASPLARITEQEIIDSRLLVYSNINGTYKINDDLSLKSSLTVSYQDLLQTRYEGLEHDIDPTEALAREFNQNRLRFVENFFVNYNKTFADHEISAVAGIAAEQEIDRITEIESRGFTNDNIPRIEGGVNFSLRDGNNYTRERRLLSFIGRVNYAYLDRYLASVSVRRDGSSVFGTNTKYGTFPAFSLGWRISEENFLAGSSILSNLKIRASYGVTGNDNINLNNNVEEWYSYRSLLSSQPVAIEGGIAQAFRPDNFANPDLRWERSIEINPGIDFGLFANRISGSVEYYQRTSDDLLLDVPVSSVTGFDAGLVNIGEVKNEGVEFEIRTFNVDTEVFKWRSTIIGSANRNTLTDFADRNNIVLSPTDGNRATEWIVSVNDPISNFYGFVVDEEIPLEFINDPFGVIGSRSRDVYAKDLNGDGVLDEDDKTILGNPYPDFIWSFSNEFTFRNFDISFMWQGSHGAEIRNIGDREGFALDQGDNGTVVGAPRSEFIVNREQTNSIVQDASYVALRNVNIGYTVPAPILQNIGLKSARVYVSGSNLLYLTSSEYTGFNPETIRQSGDFNALTFGYNRGGAPIARKVVLGVNINF